MTNFHRIRQVAKYGWLHAGEISEKEYAGKKRISLFFDILFCYRKYGMWSNQYLKERYWELDKQSREDVGKLYCEGNRKHEEWVRDFYENRKFLAKWSIFEIEADARKRELRNEAYIRHYGMGKGCIVEHGVELSRQHHLPGKIKIGNNVTLAKNVFIDYSGDVVISDHAKLANGVNIESHSHTSDGLSTDDAIKSVKPTKLLIEDWVSVGAHCTILETCNRIGRGARIGAGSVIRADVPPYAIVTGNPAKIVGFVFTPGILEEFEEEKYAPEERIPIDEYTDNYNKFFLQRISTIKEYISI